MTDTDIIKKHVAFLTDGNYEDGLIEVNILHTGQAYTQDDIESLTSQAHAWNADKSVYVVPSLLDPDTAPFGRCGEQDFYAATVLWCDIDDPHDPAVLQSLYAMCPPNIAVVTGRVPHRRVQLWWKLDEPLMDTHTLVEALTGIQQALNGDPKVLKPCQPMRLAGTTNHPSAKKQAEGRVREETEYHELHNNRVNIERVLRVFPCKGLVENCNAKQTHQPTTHTATDGLYQQDKIVDGREAYASSLVYAQILERVEQDKSLAPQDILEDVWQIYQSKVAPRGRSLDDDGRGRRMLEQKIRSKLRALEQRGVVGQPQAQAPTPTPQLKIISAEQITRPHSANDFVQNVLIEGEVSVVYGPPNCGKTFFVTDLCFHVAQGKPWHGKRVDQGKVLYLALEGVRGIHNRIVAYKQETNASLSDFHILTQDIDLSDTASTLELANLIAQSGQYKIIVIDTLARAMSGDENTPEGMSRVVRNVSALQARTNAHVCLVHHSGKDRDKGARGHTSLKGAVDTEIEIWKERDDNQSTVTIIKQRNLDVYQLPDFTLKPITIGENKHQEPITSCVVVPAQASTRAPSPELVALHEALTEHGRTHVVKGLPNVLAVEKNLYRNALASRGMSMSDAHFDATIKRMVKSKQIVVRDFHIWLA